MPVTQALSSVHAEPVTRGSWHAPMKQKPDAHPSSTVHGSPDVPFGAHVPPSQ
jgi:hypothetical protein